ncbi:MAG: DUF4412 domain-containing protein [Deltaproteobacteria bacterium]|nr:DUF4412 domain-containing protein [Deltaproteobacteria bacterium]
MTRSFLIFCASAVCASALWITAPPAAAAGVELTTEISDPSAAPPAKPVRPGRILIDGDRVRMEMTGSSPAGDAKAGGANAVMIYRGDRDVIWSVDDKRRAYMQIDRARMQAMRAQSDASRAKMRAELGKLPPAEQARMQAMLAATDVKSAEREPPTIKETGRTDKVGGLACHEIEVSRGGTKESEICVADWKAAGVTKTDLTPVRKLGTFQQETLAGLQARREGGDVLELFDALDGLPVRVRSFRAGQLRAEFRIVKVEHKALDAKLFDVPEGYHERSFSVSAPGAPGARRVAPGAPQP